MFNIDTILSSFDCKLTLLEWLKKLTKALENDSLKDVQINKIASGKAQMVLTFADGTIQASNVFELPQGETGATGAQGPKGDTGDGFNTLNKMIVSYADNVISVADGFQIDIATQFKTIVGDLLATASGTFILPIEGTGAIICDIDETNHKINIHLDATYKNKIDKALQLPQTAPSATQFVAVGTNNAQTMVGVGEKLFIENGKINNSYEIGLLEFEYLDTGIEQEQLSISAIFAKRRNEDISIAINDILGNYPMAVNGFWKSGQEYYPVLTIDNWNSTSNELEFTVYNPSLKQYFMVTKSNVEYDFIGV